MAGTHQAHILALEPTPLEQGHWQLRIRADRKINLTRLQGCGYAHWFKRSQAQAACGARPPIVRTIPGHRT
jgi:hypothetical protein